MSESVIGNIEDGQFWEGFDVLDLRNKVLLEIELTQGGKMVESFNFFDKVGLKG